VDQEVAEEFNEVLDLATKCCDEGRYGWKEKKADSADDSSQKQSTTSQIDDETRHRSKVGVISSPSQEAHDMSHTPNYVSDDTAPDSNIMPEISKIDPATDFGEVFQECRKYINEKKSSEKRDSTAGATATNHQSTSNQQQEGEEAVRRNLFQWHIAQLEMSSGAPMNKLGQRWNDDEPFSYGGDHSFLEGGLRDVVEALAEGFDCRGIGDRSVAAGGSSKEGALRRSGDFASTFGRPPSTTSGYYNTDSSGVNAMNTRGTIQCGIEVNGIKVVEREEVKALRKEKKKNQPVQAKSDKASLRRSSRENRGTKMGSFLDALSSSRSKSSSDSSSHLAVDEKTTTPVPMSSYGNDCNTVVQVTTKCGLTLEADAVIVTTPLAILSIPAGSPGHISFSPPLPTTKQNALGRLGVGAYNKCCMSFEKPFWNNLPQNLSSVSMPGVWNNETTQRFDFIGHASAEHGKDILFFNLRNAPILVAIYGGSDYSKQVENMHDEAVVLECMTVLKKICANAIKTRDKSLRTRRQVDLTVPNWPIDFFVSRWGSDPYSRGAFCFVPAGVNGFQELRAMSSPMYDFRPESGEETEEKPKRPLVMFAGEATTPYHTSTIHGAFETGIREAYRIDLALEPDLNNGITFDESHLYQPTFSVRRGQLDPNTMSLKAPKTAKQGKTNAMKNQGVRKSWWFDHDASILRGVESFGPSLETMSMIKTKILTPSGNTHSAEEMKGRYKSLMHMISGANNSKPFSNVEDEWAIPGGRGTWLVANSNYARTFEGDTAQHPEAAEVNTVSSLKEATIKEDDQMRRSSRRRAKKKVDTSFTFY